MHLCVWFLKKLLRNKIIKLIIACSPRPCSSNGYRKTGKKKSPSRLEPMIFRFHQKPKQNLGFEAELPVRIYFENLVS